MQADFDYALVGGGLQNGLVALAIRGRRPAARIAMIERGTTVGGNHTWCFHAGDGRASWIDPLVVRRWPSYDVAFPSYRRRIDASYACITSPRFADVVTATLAVPGSQLFAGATAVDVRATSVVIERAGRTDELTARVVVDARGPDRGVVDECGWQKFVGRELELAEPHGIDAPMLMDATVEQRDGFRFVYLLPMSPTRILVEDTCFSERAYLDITATRDLVEDHVRERGWRVQEVIREEVGVLPLPWSMPRPRVSVPIEAGYAGGWFHPVTGYSFPLAARLADEIAALDPERVDVERLRPPTDRHARQLRYALALNKMMFGWYPPDQRWHVLERFYRLPEATIRRFYALELTAMDRARILIGRPPRGLSLRRALRRESRTTRFEERP